MAYRLPPAGVQTLGSDHFRNYLVRPSCERKKSTPPLPEPKCYIRPGFVAISRRILKAGKIFFVLSHLYLALFTLPSVLLSARAMGDRPQFAQSRKACLREYHKWKKLAGQELELPRPPPQFQCTCKSDHAHDADFRKHVESITKFAEMRKRENFYPAIRTLKAPPKPIRVNSKKVISPKALD